jgi:hypothetical protein
MMAFLGTLRRMFVEPMRIPGWIFIVLGSSVRVLHLLHTSTFLQQPALVFGKYRLSRF